MIFFDGQKFYSAKEVGELLGVTPYAIRRYIKQGELSAHSLNGRLCVMADDLKDFIISSTTKKATQQQ